MLRRALTPAVVLTVTLATAVLALPARAKWPPWLSIESPVNPFDPTTRGAVLLVHAMVREGTTSAADLSGSAEGIVGGARRSVPLRFDATPRPGTFAVRRQWPAEGTWLLRITLRQNTTALVTLGRGGEEVAAVRVPTDDRSGQSLPRAVAAREIDSVLTDVAGRSVR